MTNYPLGKDEDGIPVGVVGDRFGNLHMTEENRQSIWVTSYSDKQELLKIMRESFLGKGVDATLFGVYGSDRKTRKYAIFVQSGFLVEETTDARTI